MMKRFRLPMRIAANLRLQSENVYRLSSRMTVSISICIRHSLQTAEQVLDYGAVALHVCNYSCVYSLVSF